MWNHILEIKHIWGGRLWGCPPSHFFHKNKIIFQLIIQLWFYFGIFIISYMLSFIIRNSYKGEPLLNPSLWWFPGLWGASPNIFSDMSLLIVRNSYWHTYLFWYVNIDCKKFILVSYQRYVIIDCKKFILVSYFWYVIIHIFDIHIGFIFLICYHLLSEIHISLISLIFILVSYQKYVIIHCQKFIFLICYYSLSKIHIFDMLLFIVKNSYWSHIFDILLLIVRNSYWFHIKDMLRNSYWCTYHRYSHWSFFWYVIIHCQKFIFLICYYSL
jgi:hypothetical protein